MPSAYELMDAEEDGESCMSSSPREEGKQEQDQVQKNRTLSRLNQDRILYLDTQMRKRATSMLFVGAASGMCGICIVTSLGLHRIFTQEGYNLNGVPFPSGQKYFPACISEMVYDPDTPSGKGFIAFMMIAAICMLVSWYPYQLRNVFIPASKRPTALCCKQSRLPTWNDYRVFVPPLGLMLVALIQSTPEGLMGFRENISEQIHANGAMAMIGSHCMFEFYACAQLPLSTCERVVRCLLAFLALFFGVSFAVTCQIYSRADELGICCKDVWAVPKVTNAATAQSNHHYYIGNLDYHRMEYDKKMIVDTAHGWGQRLKYAEFASEVLSVMFFALGLMAIWFFAPERNLDEHLGELPMLVSAEERQADDDSTE